MNYKSESTSKVWPDHVQLRLRMTSEQINEARARAEGDGATIKAHKKATRLYNEQLERCWIGTVRSKPPYVRGAFHYNYHSQLAADIADTKEGRSVRRYWNRQATRLKEKAHGNHG